MKRRFNFWEDIPFYLLLLGLYPVLFLWTANFYKIRAYVVPYTLVISLAVALFFYLTSLAITRNWLRAGALAGLGLALFYFYGHIFALVDNMSLLGLMIGRHRFLLVVWGLLFAGGAYFILRSRTDFRTLTRILNQVVLFMVVIALLQGGFLWLNAGENMSLLFSNPDQAQQPAKVSPGGKRPGPDIYYFLLDGYARQDLLQKGFDWDNRPFLDALRQKGFTIPRCGQSNYPSTGLTMASVFNMDYVDALGFSFERLLSEDNDLLLTPVIQSNPVFAKLKDRGYQIITFKSLYLPTDFPNSDIYYDIENSTLLGQKQESLRFQNLFLRTTLALPLIEMENNEPERYNWLPWAVLQIIDPGNEKSGSNNYRQYQQNLFALQKLEEIPRIEGAKFVYAHLYITHQPFTFNPDGSFRTEFRDSNAAYRDQIAYLNPRILRVVDTILEESPEPPIIIIQGDHSFTLTYQEKTKSLDALYLPGSDVKIPETFTLVNTFRLVFNEYFGENYPLLPNHSYVVGKEVPGGYVELDSSCVETEQ